MKVSLKLLGLGLGMVWASTEAYAAQVTCYDVKTNKQVMFVADDMGSITVGHMTLKGLDIDLRQDEAAGNIYSYYYGEYLLIKQTLKSDEAVELVATKSSKSKNFEGRLHYYNRAESQTLQFLKIKCVE